MVAQDDDDSDVDAGAPNYDYGGYGDDMDMDESPTQATPKASRTPRNDQMSRRLSFATLEQDEQDEEEVEEDVEPVRSPSEKARGKQRMVYADPQDDMEPDIAQGLDGIEEEPMDMEDEPVEEEVPPPKKSKASKNSRKENDGAPRGRSTARKTVLREGVCYACLVYAPCSNAFFAVKSLRTTRTLPVCVVASVGGTPHLPGGDWRRLCMVDESRASASFPVSRRSIAFPR